MALLGASRAGLSVARALAGRAGLPLRGVWARTPRAAADRSGPEGLRFEESLDADLVIIAVRDQAIPEVAARWSRASADWIAVRRPLVIHLSGSAALSDLAPAAARGARLAGLHPLRAYPAPVAGDGGLEGVDCALEGDETDLKRLEVACLAAGGRPFRLPAGARSQYHLAASIGSNLVVALLDLAVERLAGSGVAPDRAAELIGRLALGAAAEVAARGPAAALTGPVARGDAGVVAGHLDALRGDPEAADLYRLLARRTLRLARRGGAAEEVDLDAIQRLLAGGDPSR